MSAKGKEYKLAVRIAGVVDKSYEAAFVSAGAQLKTFKATMGKIDASFTKLDKGFDKITSVGKKCFKAISTAAGVATVAIGAVTAKAIQIGSEFEAEMSTVQAISGATAEELIQLTDKARSVAKETVFSASEVGEAMEYMGMAGWSATQMMDGIDGVIALAAASGEDLAMVSDIVTDSLTAMGQGAEEAGHFADIMAQASMNSNTNVELMGETFKYVAPVAGSLGYSMEDLAIATGLMASSGIKGSLAGTSLRNMLTRMAKPTKESQDAMDALGISLTDSEGKMYSLLDILQRLRESFANESDIEGMRSALTQLAGLTDDQIEEVQSNLGELTEAEEAYYAAELGGQRGMSGLLAIANSTDEEFLKLTDAIYNAEGAAEEMSNARLDNLQGDVTILKDTLQDAGIELYYQFNDKLRGAVQGVTGVVSGLVKKIPEIYKKISEAFPTIKRKFTQFAKPVIDTVKGLFSWVLDNGDKVISVIGAIAGGLAAFKIEEGIFKGFKGISGFVDTVMSGNFNGTSLVIGGIASAIGLLTGAIINYKQAQKEKIENNLADHFGTLALTMNEIKEAASFLTTTESLTEVKKAMDAFADLDQYQSAISDAVETLNKMNWKVSIGMELDVEDQESYKQAVDNYIKNVQEYATQSRYAANLNLSTMLGDEEGSSAILADVDQFYANQYDELSRLGTELNKAVTDAFNDGLLDIEEAEAVARIQRDMAAIQEKLATSKFDATLSLLELEYGGGNLTADSFMNLQEELENQIEANAETYREAYLQAIADVNTAYNNGIGLSEAELLRYNQAKAGVDSGYRSNIAEMEAKALQFQLDTIWQQYDVDELNRQLDEVMSAAVDKYMNPDNVDFYMVDNASRFQAIADEFTNNIGSILDGDIDAISELAALAESSYQELETTAQMFRDAGEKVPEDVQAALDQFGQLDSLLNLDLGGQDQADAINQYMQNIIGEGTYDEILAMEDEWGDAIGSHLPEALQAGVNASSGQYQAAADSAKSQMQSAFDAEFASPIQIAAKLNISTEMYYSSPSYWRSQVQEQNSGKKVGEHASGGFVYSKELSWLAEKVPEAVIPLDGSQNAMQLWSKTGELLGMDSLADRYDISGGSTTTNANITYSPTLQFYGEAPNRQDLDDALRMSQDEFNSMMEQYIKQNDRVSFR